MVIVQLLQLIGAFSSRWMAGNPVATMVWSTELMNRAIETMAKTSLRPGGGSPAVEAVSGPAGTSPGAAAASAGSAATRPGSAGTRPGSAASAVSAGTSS